MNSKPPPYPDFGDTIKTIIEPTHYSGLASATAAKYDKLPIYSGAIGRFPRALAELAKVSEFGTKKHEVPIDDMSYLDIPDALRVFDDALARHQNKLARGEVVNEDDGRLFHRAQLVWNALAGLERFLRDREVSRSACEIAKAASNVPVVGGAAGEGGAPVPEETTLDRLLSETILGALASIYYLYGGQ